MSASLSLHETSRELYDALPVDDETADGFHWKEVETGGVRLVFFPSRDVPDDTATEATHEEVPA